MRWRRVLGIIPVPIIYTDDLPERVGGVASGPIVRIRPRYEKDEGIHRHELAHVELFWATFWLHWVIKKLSRRYRIWNEARAFRRQMQYRNLHGEFMSLDEAANWLAGENYDFGITQEQARILILEA